MQTLFVHIPKTGGISLSMAVFGSLGGGHRSLRAYEMTFGRRRIANWFKFTVVRDPHARFLSSVNYLAGGGTTSRDRAFAEEVLLPYGSADEFVRHWVNPNNVRRQWHFVPQIEFVRPGPGGAPIDFMLRTETLDADIVTLGRRLGRELHVERLNPSDYTDVRWTTLGERSRTIIDACYEDDLALIESIRNPTGG